MKIKGFFGPYRWLSNFWEAPLTVDGVTFRCAEGAYQSQKAVDTSLVHSFADLDGKQAKHLGYKLQIRPDWDIVKDEVMLKVLRAKFEDANLRALLLATEDDYLEETNLWGDTYWGKCRGIGYNTLGILLMKVREELKTNG